VWERLVHVHAEIGWGGNAADGRMSEKTSASVISTEVSVPARSDSIKQNDLIFRQLSRELCTLDKAAPAVVKLFATQA
jgi:hypothetical protein